MEVLHWGPESVACCYCSDAAETSLTLLERVPVC